ncbi:MAG TPA: hypothetical protein VJT82_09195 [Pyrinomonadaceae bacterium]|nr:hypothetical protein [Pyrinomonadaceae bacterium]
MTGEEMERAIEFLLQGQAKHDAQLGELTDRVNQLTQQVAETNRIVQLHAETQSEFIQIVTNSFERLASAQASADKKIAEAQTQIAETNARSDARIAEMNARAAETDARLDRIASLMERHIVEGHSNS